MAADERYPLLKRDNLTIPIQMQLFQKQKLFLIFLLHFWHLEPLLKSASNYFYHINWSLSSQLSRKKSLFLTCQILGLPVNTLAANEKNSVLHRCNITIPIEMQLSQKQKTFSEFCAAFLKSRWTFEHFDKKVDLHRFCNFEITDSEKLVR